MAHIPMDDMTELWPEIRQHNWAGLLEVLKNHKGKTDGISDQLIDAMMKMSQEFQNSRHPFPASVQDLYELFNQQLQKASAKSA